MILQVVYAGAGNLETTGFPTPQNTSSYLLQRVVISGCCHGCPMQTWRGFHMDMYSASWYCSRSPSISSGFLRSKGCEELQSQ